MLLRSERGRRSLLLLLLLRLRAGIRWSLLTRCWRGIRLEALCGRREHRRGRGDRGLHRVLDEVGPVRRRDGRRRVVTRMLMRLYRRRRRDGLLSGGRRKRLREVGVGGRVRLRRRVLRHGPQVRRLPAVLHALHHPAVLLPSGIHSLLPSTRRSRRRSDWLVRPLLLHLLVVRPVLLLSERLLESLPRALAACEATDAASVKASAWERSSLLRSLDERLQRWLDLSLVLSAKSRLLHLPPPRIHAASSAVCLASDRRRGGGRLAARR